MRGGRILTAVLLGLLIPAVATAAQEPESSPRQEEKALPKTEPKPGQEPAPSHDLPDAEDPACSKLIFVPEFRVGGWWMGSFDATLSAGHRRIDSTLLFDAGLDLDLEYEGWTLALSGDYGTARDMHLLAGSVLVGRRWPFGDPQAPLAVKVSVGPLFGKLQPDIDGFGDFKSGVGWEARLDLTSQIQEAVGLGFWVSYRQISFKYEEPVLSGDTKAGGPGVAAGIGLLMRF